MSGEVEAAVLDGAGPEGSGGEGGGKRESDIDCQTDIFPSHHNIQQLGCRTVQLFASHRLTIGHGSQSNQA